MSNHFDPVPRGKVRVTCIPESDTRVRVEHDGRALGTVDDTAEGLVATLVNGTSIPVKSMADLTRIFQHYMGKQ